MIMHDRLAPEAHGSAADSARCGPSTSPPGRRTSAGRGVEGAAERPAGDAQLGGYGGSGLSSAEQDAGIGDLLGGQGAGAAADAASGAGGVKAFAGAFDDLLALEL